MKFRKKCGEIKKKLKENFKKFTKFRNKFEGIKKENLKKFEKK